MASESTGIKPEFLQSRSFRDLLRRVVVYIILTSLSVVFLVPFAWMISTAFKDPGLIYTSPPVWIPPEITLGNFERGLQLMIPSFEALFLNSTAITLLSMLGAIFSSSLVGFAFAVFKARGKNTLFTLMLATLMVPIPVVLIPQFLLFSQLDWVNSWLPLIVPQFFAAPFFVFMFRQFFGSIPRELFDSAELDGCSPFGLYWYIAAPLAKPAFATAAIFSFLGSWNDLLNPLIYLNELKKFTLALGLANFQATNYTLLQYLMPMALLGLIPVLILFFLAQKYFVQGIVTTGMKG
jgi:ABC-type glycerol-3-phosphate transport system permease component